MTKTEINKMHEHLDEILNEVSKLQTILGLVEAENEIKEEKNEIANAFDCLAVTNVQVYPFKEGEFLGHVKGLATIVLNDQMLIRGLRIMDGENGLFVGYPNDPFYKGEDFRCICNPITRQLREHIENVVLEKYQEVING